MSIHVCSCMHHGVGEWHLRYPGMSQEAAQGIADKINSGMLDGKQADRIAALESELAQARAEREQAIAEVECLWVAIQSHCSAATIKAIESELESK